MIMETYRDETIASVKHYSYDPQDNITLFELALIMPLFQSSSIYSFNAGVEQLPETVKRHFKRT